MIFPTLSFWSSRDPEDAIGRIDRALDDRNHRLSAGLSISDQFDMVRGALVVSQGNGKYLRIRHVVDACLPIPQAIRSGFLGIVTKRDRDIGQMAQLLSDLAETQAAVVEQLKCSAGKYVDRVLAVAVRDPGYWEADFDGRVSYTALCDPARLAEICGVTVIDSFPARDLAVGGNGGTLEALPLWMIFADRDPKVADQTRALLNFSRQSQGYVFPASDGLDAEIPQIRSFPMLGQRFLDALVKRRMSQQESSKQARTDWAGIYAKGQEICGLMRTWDSAVNDFDHSSPSNESSRRFALAEKTWELDEYLVRETNKYIDQHSSSFPDLIRTAITWVVERVADGLERHSPGELDEVFVASDLAMEPIIIDQLTRSLSTAGNAGNTGNAVVSPAQNQGVTHDQIDSVVAAVLGLFHMDQMPANVPWLTGADGQRILGRLTPGRPANWRQLVRVMADFHPAPMKLKDAI
jgi:anhydro-N-acetylmuramic acid kinase